MSTRTSTQNLGLVSLSRNEEGRLERPGPQFIPAANIIATSISPSSWLAVATSKHVRLYGLSSIMRSRVIPLIVSLIIELCPSDNIRDVALSEDLLIVLTRSRLLVYDEYKTIETTETLKQHLVEARHLVKDEFHTIAVEQNGTSLQGEGAVARVALGGVGAKAVRIYSYVFRNCWNARACRILLKCPNNLGSIKGVGFSPYRRNASYGPIIFALTADNNIYCWQIDDRDDSITLNVYPSWNVDTNPRENRHILQNEISSVSMAICSQGKPYMICTVNHCRSSYLGPSFVIPILEDNPLLLRRKMRPLAEGIISPNVVAGASSNNGQFLVIVERGWKKQAIKVLRLRRAQDGGLTCSNESLTWITKLRGHIRLSVSEAENTLNIIAVDDRGNIASAEVNVLGMPAQETPQIPQLGSIRTSELHEYTAALAGELPAEGNSHDTIQV